MNWIKQNTFLSGLLAVVVLCAGGLGYLLTKAKGTYDAALEDYQTVAASKKALDESKLLYPSEENQELYAGLVSEYKAAASALRREVLDAQAPMAEGVIPSRFQDSLREKVDEVVNKAEASSVKLAENFFLGMDDYRSVAPIRKAASKLQFQLDATHRLAMNLLNNEVTFLNIKRDKLAFEKGDDDPAPTTKKTKGKTEKAVGPSVEEIFPMEVVFSASPGGFQQILNDLSNTDKALGKSNGVLGGTDYYFVIRYLRIENDKKMGAPRGEWQEPTPADADDPDAAATAATEPERPMAFGAERVRAYLALDLVRLISPEAAAVEAAAEKDADEK